MRLTREDLNRTLLQRQGLLERRSGSVADLVRHLVGLQAQEGLSPYVGLAARLAEFDPGDVTAGLEDRRSCGWSVCAARSTCSPPTTPS